MPARLELRVQPSPTAAGRRVAAVVSICAGEPPAPEGRGLVLEYLRLSVAGRSVFHPSWAVVPDTIAPSLRVSGREGSVWICTTGPAEAISNLPLPPGEVHTLRFEAELPEGLPPSFSGTAIKHIYSVVACARLRGGAEEVTAQQPIRVLVRPCLPHSPRPYIAHGSLSRPPRSCRSRSPSGSSAAAGASSPAPTRPVSRTPTPSLARSPTAGSAPSSRGWARLRSWTQPWPAHRSGRPPAAPPPALWPSVAVRSNACLLWNGVCVG